MMRHLMGWPPSIYMQNETLAMSTTDNAGTGYCVYCSNPPYSLVYHSGRCPLVRAKEYHPDGRLKRIEFNEQRAAEINVDFNAPLFKPFEPRQVVIEEPTLLEPGRYTIIDGELFKLEDRVPPGLESVIERGA